MKLKIIFVIAIVFLVSCTNNEVEDKMVNTIATFETTMGNFKVELFEDKSPITAGNFKKLAQEGFYDGTRFHRVIANFMVHFRIAGTSDAMKFSFLPKPRIRGLSFLAAISLSGSLEHIIPRA